MQLLVSYRVYIRLSKHGYDITAPLDAPICSLCEWKALIGLLTPEYVLGANGGLICLQTNKANLPFGIENKVRYSQLL